MLFPRLHQPKRLPFFIVLEEDSYFSFLSNQRLPMIAHFTISAWRIVQLKKRSKSRKQRRMTAQEKQRFLSDIYYQRCVQCMERSRKRRVTYIA